MSHPLRIGLKLAPQIHPIETHRAFWRIGDDAGFDHLWSFDHLAALGSDPARPIFEGWAMLAAMAALTTRVRIGLMVTGNLYRHPGLLAKLAVTADHLSNGRLEMGIGAAWAEAEFKMLGMPFPPLGERISRLGEACRVMKLLWTETRATYAGRYYRLSDAIAEPKPIQKPYPPLWIGGSGPKHTLRVVARHADVWNSNSSLNVTSERLEADVASSRLLDEHCAAVKRDPATIRRSVQIRFNNVDGDCRLAERYYEAGFSEIIFMATSADPLRTGETIAREILPRLRTLS